MHAVGEENGSPTFSNVPAFLAKLWKLVEDLETDDLICWSDSGASFYIRNQALFARQLLPLYYKHNNMASFIRQLNMYGFRKVSSVEQGSLRVDKDEMEFQHNYFLRGHEYLLENIKRKLPSGTRQSEDFDKVRPDFAQKVLTDVRILKGKQDSVDKRLAGMKRENEVLWREVASLRQKHFKQQQIVNKLIQFLVTLVQRKDISTKRRYPLAIQESEKDDLFSPSGSKQRRKFNDKGPIIHDLTNDMIQEASKLSSAESLENPAQIPIRIESDDQDEVTLEPYCVVEPVLTDEQENSAAANGDYAITIGYQIGDDPVEIISERPVSAHSSAESNPRSPSVELMTVNPKTLTKPTDVVNDEESGAFIDESLIIPTLEEPVSLLQGKFSGKHQKIDDKTVAIASDSLPMNRLEPCRNDLDNHLENFDVELEGLKDLMTLQNGGTFDVSSLLSLFDTDDSLHSALPMPMPSASQSSNSKTGNEVITYNPVLDLGYDDHSFFRSESDQEADSSFLLESDYLIDVNSPEDQLINSTLNTPVHAPEAPLFSSRKKK
ncbi:heat shock factor protein-like isoform X2 [Artemia franciscana]|uniref:HSF-type DNA-binding domain-containing protein n=1 Tax=Artemia franciscana TaxID=6661 RepID=A0AA88IGB4_ARTSF|nr:hypothetical protein QYM36_002185 [Artemia franciscana]